MAAKFKQIAYIILRKIILDNKLKNLLVNFII